MLLSVFVVALVVATTSLAMAQRYTVVAPPMIPTHGQSYEAWAEDWHAWALSIESDENPLIEHFTGETSDCTHYQVGDVWFLAGLIGGGTITRQCTVTDETAMFFPVVNQMWFPYADDPPPDTATLEASFRQAVQGAGGWATVDGKPVPYLQRYQVHTSWFRAWMPEDNVIDWIIENFDPGNRLWGEGWSRPHFNDGIYLMVEPLDVGPHEIKFGGWGGAFEVTYDLDVVSAP